MRHDIDLWQTIREAIESDSKTARLVIVFIALSILKVRIILLITVMLWII